MWNKIKFFFSKTWIFIAPTVKVLSNVAIQEFLPIAVDAVKATAEYALDNDEAKKKMAYERIETAAKAKGKTLSTSVINLLIELAVQSIKV